MVEMLNNSCQNFTIGVDSNHCNTDIVDVTFNINKTNTNDMEEEIAVANIIHMVRYYIEGVTLTPIATIGLFGKFIVHHSWAIRGV